MPEKARLRRWLRFAVLALVGLELVYVIGANAFLASDWGQAKLNRRPEKLAMRWSSAWTFLPGLVHVRELGLEGGARRARWRANMDSARLFIWLPALAGRHLSLLSSSARGAAVEIDTQPAPDTPRPERRRRGWRISLRRLALADLARVRVNQVALEGVGTVRGLAAFEVRGPMRFDFSQFDFQQARLLAGDQVAADSLALEAVLELGEVTIGETTVADLLAATSGDVELEAEASSLGFLAAYLGRFPWIELGGSGHLELDLEIARGWLAPSSRLSFVGPAIGASFMGLDARGGGSVRGSIPEGSGHVRLEARLDEFEVRRPVDTAVLLAGEALSVVVTNDSTAIDRPAEGVAVAMTLPPAQVPDLAALAPYVPESTGLAIVGGEAEISAELAYSAADRNGEGWLRLAGRQVTADFEDLAVRANVSLDARFPEVRLEGGTLGLGGSSLRVDGVEIEKGEVFEVSDWWSRIEIPAGTLSRRFGVQPPEPAVIEGRLEAELLDTSPLTAVIRDRVPKLSWFDELLTVENVDLSSDFRLVGPEIRLTGLEIQGGAKDRLEILAELDLRAKQVDGVLLAAWGPLTAAVALEEEGRDWKLTRSRQWYAEQVERYRSESSAREPNVLAGGFEPEPLASRRLP
jgi:hypothetical protein